MRKTGVYGSALIKKIHYWLRGVLRDSINEYFRIKQSVTWYVLWVSEV